jgi:hypothetical protein
MNLLDWFCFFRIKKCPKYSDHYDHSDYFFFDEETGHIEPL